MKLHTWTATALALILSLGLGLMALAGPDTSNSRDDVRTRADRADAVQATYQVGARDGDDDDDDDSDGGSFCSDTARLQLRACRAEAADDYFSALAACIQVGDRAERNECESDAAEGRSEMRALCREQAAARADLCDLVGEARYDPDFDPAAYIDDFSDPAGANPYYPLVVGYRWAFVAEDEGNVIEVLPKTKLIEGVTCLVINDLVTKEDGGGEDTDDWYAQRLDGTVTYCGESVQDFEVFEGDDPPEPELTSIDGSFKHGRDGDLAGTIMPSPPVAGQAYRQEVSFGNAEDAAIILSTTYGFGSDAELDGFVPQELVETMCAAHDCVVTGEITPVEPDLFDRKYYAKGLGLFLEVDAGTGEINQLVSCNFDPRCDDLPEP